jgi:hypothetical protein
MSWRAAAAERPLDSRRPAAAPVDLRAPGRRVPLAACLRALLSIGAVLTSACGPAVMRLPAGPGAPASDGALVLSRATSACRAVRTFTAELGVTGSVASHRIRGRVLAGAAVPASLRLEAPAPFGAPVFIFVATGEDATLVLPRDDRMLEHGRPEAVLEAMAGVPLGAAQLFSILTGCPTGPVDAAQAREIGETWRVIPGVGGGDDLYLHREDSSNWHLVALLQGGGPGRSFRADFHGFERDLPSVVRMTSTTAGRSSSFDLIVTLSQIELNVPLPADAFHVRVPESAKPITVEELRETGLLGTR